MGWCHPRSARRLAGNDERHRENGQFSRRVDGHGRHQVQALSEIPGHLSPLQDYILVKNSSISGQYAGHVQPGEFLEEGRLSD
jgi:hypothetical protein